jgi:hypothetical protein
MTKFLRVFQLLLSPAAFGLLGVGLSCEGGRGGKGGQGLLAITATGDTGGTATDRIALKEFLFSLRTETHKKSRRGHHEDAVAGCMLDSVC